MLAVKTERERKKKKYNNYIKEEGRHVGNQVHGHQDVVEELCTCQASSGA